MKKRHATSGDVPLLIHTVCWCPQFNVVFVLISASHSPAPVRMTKKVPQNEVLTDALHRRSDPWPGYQRFDRRLDSVYDDSNVEQMANISPEAPHRAIDLAIIKADTEGTPTSRTATPSR